MRSIIAVVAKAASKPRSAAPSPRSAYPSPAPAILRGKRSWPPRFDSEVLEDVMGWSWVIGLGFAGLGTVITGGLALAIGLGVVNASDCAWTVFVAAGVGVTGLLLFVVAVLIALLK